MTRAIEAEPVVRAVLVGAFMGAAFAVACTLLVLGWSPE